MTILALLALLLPGLAWWAWFGKPNRDPFISLAQVIGVSLSVIILLAQFVFFLGLRFSLAGLLCLLAGFLTLAGLGLRQKGIPFPKPTRPYGWVGLLLLGLIVAWRLFQASSLLLPNWVDGQHHTLIVRVILEQRGLPETLAPYLSVPFYYHYGFHAVTALFTVLSGLEVGAAILLLGQVLNALISLSVYALAKTLWADWRPALAAALLTAFVTRMPAYYLSWGRYTLTLGMVLMPLAVMVALRLSRQNHRKRDAAALAMLTAGVLLTHYFTALLLAIFLVFLTIIIVIRRPRFWRSTLVHFAWVPVAALTGLLLASPWLTRVLRFSFQRAGVGVYLPESLGAVFNNLDRLDYIGKLLGPTSNHWLLLAGGIGLLLGLFRRNNIPFLTWSLALAFLTLPWSFTFEPFRSDHFAIILFLPSVSWAGFLFWQIGVALDKPLKVRLLQTALPLLLVAGWILWAFPLSAAIVNPVTVLVTEDDLQALAWIDENTPEDARFFINTAYWLNQVYRGVDGGGWTLPITGRWAVVPTVFYGFSPDPKQNLQIREWGERASRIDACSADFLSLVEDANLSWVYLRTGTGSLQPDDLTACPGIVNTFSNSSVFIYQIGK